MNTPHYKDSYGNSWTTPQINRKSDKSAKELLELQKIEHGYNFCTKCKRNTCKPIDVSHNITRKFAKENGCVEVLWSKENLEILGRFCHLKKDKNNLKFKDES